MSIFNLLFGFDDESNEDCDGPQFEARRGNTKLVKTDHGKSWVHESDKRAAAKIDTAAAIRAQREDSNTRLG